MSVNSESNDTMEMQKLVDDLEQGHRNGGQATKSECFFQSLLLSIDTPFQRVMLSIDERCNMKTLMRMWGTRLDFIVRLMLVATFLDDSFRMATHFTEHTANVEQESMQWLLQKSPTLVSATAVIALGIGLSAQFVGSFCLLSLQHLDLATKALIGWVIAQPVLYAQLFNLDFIIESLSVLGGLLILRSHLVFDQSSDSAHIQLLGRLLIPPMALYHAFVYLSTVITPEESSNAFDFVSSLSMVVLYIMAFLVLVFFSVLVAVGLKSRLIALLLALINLGIVFYNHPFFRYDNMPIPHQLQGEDIDWDQIYDYHRYYFFLGISTSGALLLLTQFGPGEIAVQKNEVLVVQRGKD